MARVRTRKLSCQWSVSTFTRTRVAVKRRTTRASDQINLGVVRNLCPNSPFRTRKVTFGIMAAIARSEVNSICREFFVPNRALEVDSAAEGVNVELFATVLNLYIQYPLTLMKKFHGRRVPMAR